MVVVTIHGLVVEAPVVALPRWLLLLPVLPLFPHQQGTAPDDWILLTMMSSGFYSQNGRCLTRERCDYDWTLIGT